MNKSKYKHSYQKIKINTIKFFDKSEIIPKNLKINSHDISNDYLNVEVILTVNTLILNKY